jgi:hypothetical protein
MNAVLVAAVVAVGPFQAPPPWLLWGYGWGYPAYGYHHDQQMTIPGRVVQPETAMFRIQSRAGEKR